MAGINGITLPHGTIPTQMFGNVNLQNAVMYINENFTAIKDDVNSAISSVNESLDEKAELDHDHDAYAALEHTHGQSEIVGLSAALDGKAELNHEHSQYLTSMPTHYHSTSEVQGLGEQLQQKAEAVHSHDISQVEGLTTELGLKASTTYVDQQVDGVGSSIKTIADEEIKNKAAANGSQTVNLGYFPNDTEQPESANPLWTAGGDTDATILLAFTGVDDGAGGYEIRTCKMTLSPLGTIKKIEQIKNGGISIV